MAVTTAGSGGADAAKGPVPTIRTAVPSDAPRLAELSTELGYPATVADLGPRLRRILGRADSVVLVAELPGGEVVGWLHGAEVEILEHGPRCEILGLVVAAGRRRHGTGRRLVAEVEEWAAARGLDEITVRSNVVRTESHPFYERLGYTRAKTQHAYRKPLTEAMS
jgi:GNAT superfamily N-acetyltransferase